MTIRIGSRVQYLRCNHHPHAVTNIFCYCDAVIIRIFEEGDYLLQGGSGNVILADYEGVKPL